MISISLRNWCCSFIAASCVEAGFTSCCVEEEGELGEEIDDFLSCEIGRAGNSPCYCDQACFSSEDCCSDIEDVPCFDG